MDRGSSSDWRCEACGERSPDGFEACWSCGAGRREGAPEAPAPSGESRPPSPPAAPSPSALPEVTAVVLLVAGPFYVFVLAGWLWSVPTPAHLSPEDALYLLLFLVQVVAALWIVSRWRGERFSAYGVSPPRVGRDLAIGCLALIASYGGSALFEAAWTGEESAVSEQSGAAGSPAQWVLVVAATLAAAAAEEILWRGYVLQRAERCFRSTTVAVVVSSLLFAAYHLHYGFVGFLWVLFIGVVFAGAFLVARSVWPSTVAHALLNLLLLL